MLKTSKLVPFSQVIEDLLDNRKPFPPVHLHRFSDINPEDLNALKIIWLKVDLKRRVTLFEDLEDLSDSDTLVCFDELAIFALQDVDPQVRAIAIRLLWETNEISVPRRLIKILKNDPDEVVRAGAASGLGAYVYKGELEKISSEIKKKVEDVLLSTFSGKDTPLVKRKCLESLGFISRKDIAILIKNAFNSDDLEWRASALISMGRSADNRWRQQVIESLDDSDPEIRFEAIRAAGELELKETRQKLMEFLLEPENREDENISHAIIWSLSQIGGENVGKVLSELIELAEDEEEVEFIEEAIDNLSLTDGLKLFNLLDIPFDEGEEGDDFYEDDQVDREDDDFS